MVIVGNENGTMVEGLRCNSSVAFLSFFLCRYFHNSFESNHKATIGVDFMCQQYKILGIPFKMQVLVVTVITCHNVPNRAVTFNCCKDKQYTHTHAHAHTHMRAHTHIHTHLHTHARTHTHTHTRAHTFTLQY